MLRVEWKHEVNEKTNYVKETVEKKEKKKRKS